MKNVEIVTSNALYEDGKCVGGYHEIHKINYVQNEKHLIATLDSIIKNNLLYGCDETVLESVNISCDSQMMVDALNKYYNGLCGKVKICAELEIA